MAVKPLKIIGTRMVLALFLLASLLITLHLMSSAVQNSATLSRLYIPLLLFNSMGLLVLVVLIGISLKRLLGDYRRNRPGARLTLRMVVLFVLLSLLPVGVVYFYSMQFLLRGIDSWFDVEIDKAMEDALSLGKASLDLQKRQLLQQTNQIKRQMIEDGTENLLIRISRYRSLVDATELTVMDQNGRVLASRNVNPGVLVADTPDIGILQQARSLGSYVGLVSYGEQNLLHIRVIVVDLATSHYIQALYPTTERVSTLIGEVQDAYEQYQQLSYLRRALKQSFSLTLLLVLLFSFFSAVWAAIYSARRLLSPIADLGQATRAVAEGDYTTRLAQPRSDDELAFLVSSFNDMTLRIGQARDAAARSQQEVERQREYLHTLLEHLSTGVISIDDEGLLRTSNSAANSIFGIDFDNRVGDHIASIARDAGWPEEFIHTLKSVWESEAREQRGQVSIDTSAGRKELQWHTTSMSGSDGYLVLMFDDITGLIRAQKESAWGEVARRLAHEIKNPLTPIQLSAERLRRKYMHKIDNDEVLDRATHTIIQQVEAMKGMVNDFSDYAKPSIFNPEPLEFDRLLRDVLGLYASEKALRCTFEAGDAMVDGDAVKLRQVLHNFVKNALEAVAECAQPEIIIKSTVNQAGACHFVQVSIQDNGSGFAPEMLGKVFEPYVTTKQRGTGLGLAIVKRIVDEHDGGVWVANAADGGAMVIMRLPLCGQRDACRRMPEPNFGKQR
ncbi:MAG: ATP-binding protein [Gammaproteobacteria bacterium]